MPTKVKKILIVEDDPDLMTLEKLVCSSVRNDDVSILCLDAYSGQEAITVALEEKPDLVLLDLNLPDISGFEVAGKLKESGITSPIIVVTASAMRQQVDEAYKISPLVITKPFLVGNLAAIVTKVIKE